MTAPGALGRILASRRRRLAAEMAACPLAEVRARAAAAPPALDFPAALRRSSRAGIAVLAELKSASPSAGVIRERFEAVPLARDLAAAGAAALSVLTESDHFGGSGERLAAVRAALPATPLLRKDFVTDPWQVWESRALGADAVLLIIAALDDAALAGLLETASEAGLAALVEAHDGGEAARAAAAGATCIGINARDLRSFRIDMAAVLSLAADLPPTATRVAESGVSGPRDLALLRTAGYHAALVGTALMQAPDPGAELSRWLQEASR